MPFHPTDLPHLLETCRESTYWPLPQTALDGWRRHLIARTLYVGTEIWACGGLVCPWPTLGHAFLYCRAAEGELGRRVAWAIRRGWRQVLAASACKRIEALVLADFVLAHRLATAIGFREVFRKEHYGPDGQTFVEYVMVR